MKSKFKDTEIGMIPDEWEVVKLGSLGLLRNGVNFNRKDFGTGYPIINVKNLYSGRYATIDDLDEIMEGTIKNIEGYTLEKGDLLFARSSLMHSGAGQVSMVNSLPHKFTLFSGFIIRFRINSENIYHDFLNYLLRSPRYREYLTRIALGTTITNLTQDILSDIPIILPEIKEQERIVNLLNSLDSKIELNHQMNKTLEAIDQAIFKHWFVDFEFPCLPDGAGKPYDRVDLVKLCTYKAVGGIPSPQQDKYFIYVILCDDSSFYIGITDDIHRRWYEHCTGMGSKWTKSHNPVKIIHYEEYTSKNEAAKREKWLKTGFGRKWLKREYAKYLKLQAGSPAPKCKLRQAGEMVFNEELGKEIPEGWEVKTIGDVVTVKGGTTPSTKKQEYWDNGSIHWCTPKDLSNLGSPVLLYTERKITNKGLATISSGLLPTGTVLLSSRAPIGYLAISEVPVSINQGFIAILCDKEVSNYYILNWVKFNLGIIKNMAGGSTFQEINKANFRIIKILVPSQDIMRDYNTLLNKMHEGIVLNEKQSRKLVEIRDTLLPKLMSGKIRVLNNQKIKEAV